MDAEGAVVDEAEARLGFRDESKNRSVAKEMTPIVTNRIVELLKLLLFEFMQVNGDGHASLDTQVDIYLVNGIER